MHSAGKYFNSTMNNLLISHRVSRANTFILIIKIFLFPIDT